MKRIHRKFKVNNDMWSWLSFKDLLATASLVFCFSPFKETIYKGEEYIVIAEVADFFGICVQAIFLVLRGGHLFFVKNIGF